MCVKMSQKVACMEELISAVKNRPAIYDLTHQDHKDQSKVLMAWNEVVQVLKDMFSQELKTPNRIHFPCNVLL